MVKGVSMREDPCHGLFKHLGIVLVLGREKCFLSKSSLSERSQESKPSDKFRVILQDFSCKLSHILLPPNRGQVPNATIWRGP